MSTTHVVSLIVASNDLYVRLSAQWGWLDAHPDHPKYGEREDAFLALLGEYEQIEDDVGYLDHLGGLDTWRGQSWRERQ